MLDTKEIPSFPGLVIIELLVPRSVIGFAWVPLALNLKLPLYFPGCIHMVSPADACLLKLLTLLQ